MIGLHCDNDGCQTWASRNMALESGFLIVNELGAQESHFCSHDCLITHYAKRAPLEEAP